MRAGYREMAETGSEYSKIEEGFWPAPRNGEMFRVRLYSRVVHLTTTGKHKGIINVANLANRVGHRSAPNWRWMEIDQISDEQLLDQTFAGRRDSV